MLSLERSITSVRINTHFQKNPLFLPRRQPGSSFMKKEEARGAKGTSTIFDETVEHVGGIIGCQEMANMPRNKKQVIYVRTTVSSRDREDEFSSLLSMAKTDPVVHNLQWTPSPRVIFCADGQIKDIIEECCKQNSSSILSIDTTFNIGEFYVTSTTYQSSKFYNTEIGKRTNLPGPAMFHAKNCKERLSCILPCSS